MDRKPKGSAVGTLTTAQIARGLESAARAGIITGEEENILRMRTGARVPLSHPLERADGGNPKARAKIEEIQADIFRRLLESAGDGPTPAKEKIIQALKKK